MDTTKFACPLTCPGDISGPLSAIAEIGLVVLQPNLIPANHGVICYWQLETADGQQHTEFELLGTLTSPSSILYTGWGDHEQMIASAATAVRVNFGISIEPISTIENLGPIQNSPRAKQLISSIQVAKGIAEDLFHYMSSFDTGGAAGHMLVPQNVFDRWYQRFESRIQRNPNFFLKKS